MTAAVRAKMFHGWRVVGAAFMVAVFGWGVGFYGPPVFLSVIQRSTGWPLVLVSAAVTMHFLVGAIAGANLPAIHRRFGLPAVTKAGALALGGGVIGWAAAAAPWQLFVATLLTGFGWGTMSAAALNAIVSPWFVRARPAALSMAYNGGSIGGVIFSPLWVAAIGILGFPLAAVAVALVMAAVIWVLADRLLSRTPEELGLMPDGDAAGTRATPIKSPDAEALPGVLLWRSRRFQTLSAGMALGLFAQIGLVAHLFSLMVPALGAQSAGLAMGLITAVAVAGRTILGWVLPLASDRRLVACASYAVQLCGSVAFVLASGDSVPLLLLGIVLFGIGFGNATSLPPLIAQVEFIETDVPRVVALVVAIAQAGFALAPVVFGLIRQYAWGGAGPESGVAPGVFIAAAAAQALAICAFLWGRR
jgi:MFS family permease